MSDRDPRVSRRDLLGGWFRKRREQPVSSGPALPAERTPDGLVPLRAFRPAGDSAPVPLSAELEVGESPPPWRSKP